MSQSDIRSHPVVSAIYDPVQAYFERYQAPPHREYLAADLDGRVLEIAVGTGAMIPYFAEHADDAARLHGVEPDPGMYRRAREELPDRSIEMGSSPGERRHSPTPQTRSTT